MSDRQREREGQRNEIHWDIRYWDIEKEIKKQTDRQWKIDSDRALC